jgi:hypothetical protein
MWFKVNLLNLLRFDDLTISWSITRKLNFNLICPFSLNRLQTKIIFLRNRGSCFVCIDHHSNNKKRWKHFFLNSPVIFAPASFGAHSSNTLFYFKCHKNTSSELIHCELFLSINVETKLKPRLVSSRAAWEDLRWLMGRYSDVGLVVG